MTRRSSAVLSLIALSVTALSACGGNVENGPGEERGGANTGASSGSGASAGSGGAVRTGGKTGAGGAPGTGGQSAAGGQVAAGGQIAAGGSPSSGAQSAGGATPASGGSGTGCCLAAPLCDPGDHQIVDKSQCGSGVECYSRSICCSTILCARSLAQCQAYPICDSGDMKLDGPCPPDLSCYTRSLCGSTIYCLEGSGAGGSGGAGGAPACDPALQYNRKYVATDPKTCTLIDFACPANTEYFGDSCGCGCEQQGHCPRTVDCAPGQRLDVLCNQPERCPYTLRAL